MQPPSLGRLAFVPLAAAVTRPSVFQQIDMTHELIINMLGVRGEGVAEAAGKLQKLGAIEYVRGKSTVRDQLRLASRCLFFGEGTLVSHVG
jgi:hypothetical protein